MCCCFQVCWRVVGGDMLVFIGVLLGLLVCCSFLWVCVCWRVFAGLFGVLLAFSCVLLWFSVVTSNSEY